MTADLRSPLQSTLGSTYSIERELGGGGMSRVFVARDEALGRDVVAKIIGSRGSRTPPSLSAASMRRWTTRSGP